MSGIASFSTGIFLSGVRLSEPLFRLILITKAYEFFGKVYKPRRQTVEELATQDKALNTILVSSLNVELVYIVLKAIETFAQDPLSNVMTSRKMIEGLIVQDDENEVKNIIEIDLNADQLAFERRVLAESTKKRRKLLHQIEIKMVEDFASKGISDFMTNDTQSEQAKESEIQLDTPFKPLA